MPKKPKENPAFTKDQKAALSKLITDIACQVVQELRVPLMTNMKISLKLALAEFVKEKMEMDEFIRKQTDKKLN